jgi:hypothetical protein
MCLHSVWTDVSHVTWHSPIGSMASRHHHGRNQPVLITVVFIINELVNLNKKIREHYATRRRRDHDMKLTLHRVSYIVMSPGQQDDARLFKDVILCYSQTEGTSSLLYKRYSHTVQPQALPTLIIPLTSPKQTRSGRRHRSDAMHTCNDPVIREQCTDCSCNTNIDH